MSKWAQLAISILIINSLTACGGSGGGGAPASNNPANNPAPASTKSFPLAQAIANFASDSHRYNFSITISQGSDSVSGSGTATMAAATSVTFEGQQALSSVATFTASLSDGSTTIPFAATAQGIVTTNYVSLGMISAEEYCVYRSNTASYPTSIEVGDTGVIGTADCYTNSNKIQKTQEIMESYVIEADGPDNAIYNTVMTFKSVSGVVTETDQNRYRITESGIATWVSESYSDLSESPPIIMNITVQ